MVDQVETAPNDTLNKESSNDNDNNRDPIYVRVKRNKSTWIVQCYSKDTLKTLHDRLLSLLNPSKTAQFEYQPHVACESESFIVPEDVEKLRLCLVPSTGFDLTVGINSQSSLKLTQLTGFDTVISNLGISNDSILVLCLPSQSEKFEPPKVDPMEAL